MGEIGKNEMNEIEKIKGRALKRIFNLPISTSYIGLTMETGTGPANQRIQYSTIMLYHNVVNSDHKRVVKNISRTNKKQPQERRDLKSTADSTINRSENKKCEEHEQIQMEKAGERKDRKVNRRKNKAGDDK